jgi:hypothetical protein
MASSVLALCAPDLTLHVVEHGADAAALTLSLTDERTGQRLVFAAAPEHADTLTSFLNMLRLARLEVEAM